MYFLVNFWAVTIRHGKYDFELWNWQAAGAPRKLLLQLYKNVYFIDMLSQQ